MLHPGQVLRGSLPLLSPRFLDVPTFHHQVPPRPPRRERSPAAVVGTVGENVVTVILPKWRLPRHLGIFYMPQIYDMGPTALLPLRRKACWGFFALKIRWLWPGLNPRTWVLKASTLPFDHRNRLHCTYTSDIKRVLKEKLGRHSNVWPVYQKCGQTAYWWRREFSTAVEGTADRGDWQWGYGSIANRSNANRNR